MSQTVKALGTTVKLKSLNIFLFQSDFLRLRLERGTKRNATSRWSCKVKLSGRTLTSDPDNNTVQRKPATSQPLRTAYTYTSWFRATVWTLLWEPASTLCGIHTTCWHGTSLDVAVHGKITAARTCTVNARKSYTENLIMFSLKESIPSSETRPCSKELTTLEDNMLISLSTPRSIRITRIPTLAQLEPQKQMKCSIIPLPEWNLRNLPDV